jgi:hypothetical protein
LKDFYGCQNDLERGTPDPARGPLSLRIDNPESQREVLIALTEAGQQLVDAVSQRRPEELDRLGPRGSPI